MRYGILGTGDVAHAIATKLIGLGHEVMMGARSVTNEKALSWACRVRFEVERNDELGRRNTKSSAGYKSRKDTELSLQSPDGLPRLLTRSHYGFLLWQ